MHSQAATVTRAATVMWGFTTASRGHVCIN